MSLPVPHDASLDAFAAYSTAWWPVALALWIATLAGATQLVRGRAHGAGLAALLALHWAWSWSVTQIPRRVGWEEDAATSRPGPSGAHAGERWGSRNSRRP